MLTDLLVKLTRHEDLTADEAAAAMDLVMTGQATLRAARRVARRACR